MLPSSAGAAPAIPDSSARAADPYHDHWLARDKAAHFALSCALVGFGYHLGTREVGAGHAPARTAAVSVTISLGVAKEMRDGAAAGNHFSRKDLVTDILGTAAGLFLFTRK